MALFHFCPAGNGALAVSAPVRMLSAREVYRHLPHARHGLSSHTAMKGRPWTSLAPWPQCPGLGNASAAQGSVASLGTSSRGPASYVFPALEQLGPAIKAELRTDGFGHRSMKKHTPPLPGRGHQSGRSDHSTWFRQHFYKPPLPPHLFLLLPAQASRFSCYQQDSGAHCRLCHLSTRSTLV